MKKSLVFLLILMLLLTTTGTAFAAGKGPHGSGAIAQSHRPGYFTISGTITAISAEFVTVQLVGGNSHTYGFAASEMTVVIKPETIYLLTDGVTATPIEFSDLAVDQSVSVHGIVADGVWTAYRITVGASLIHYQ